MIAAVSPFNINKDKREVGEMTSQSMSMAEDDSPEFLLNVSIDFDDLFMGINDEDMLPDLEFNPDFSLLAFSTNEKDDQDEEGDKVSGNLSSGCGEEESPVTGSKGNELSSSPVSPVTRNNKKGRSSKGSTNSKEDNIHGKRKVKVDWTPDLHRRFVQAVEQLGIEKAVPSRILELMGIDCLTRHNIASHLQKYRSHRKHLLAREADAANWNQRRQLYGTTGVGRKNMIGPWVGPTMGFPQVQHFRPLHVWGQPSADQSMVVHMWPKHNIVSSPSTAAAAAWSSSPTRPHFYQRPPATPGFPAPIPSSTAAVLTTTRLAAPTVQGIPHHHHVGLYRPAVDAVGNGSAAGTPPHPPTDFHLSDQSIDVAIGDALSKPWLPLPIGLKSPSLDSVMGELHRQGVPKIPLTMCSPT